MKKQVGYLKLVWEKDTPESVLGNVRYNQVYYGTRIDYNLQNITGSWYEYIDRLVDALFNTIVNSKEKFTTAWHYIKVDIEFKKLSLLQCKNLLYGIDEYLERVHVQQSKEKEFFMRIRNLCFMKIYYFRKKLLK